MANFKNYGDEDYFKEDLKNISRGDIIGVNGIPKRTPAGELSVLASEIKVLTPCLRLMPSTWDKVKNRETKYRKRYLDLIFNEESRKTHLLRTRIILFIRNFLNNLQFIEVETPILSSSAGGAIAEPFTTKHYALGLDLHLRISPELYLKMLVIGGMEKVFEIGKLFRNEGEDLTHNPEFTALELYQAYADYKDMMELTESVLSLLANYLYKNHTIEYDGQDQAKILDFSPPFKKIDFLQSLEDALNVSLPPAPELHLEESKSFLYDLCMKHNLQVTPSTPVSKLLDKLCSKFVESELVNPTFIINHPVIMSPLAKGHRSKPGLTERFELFITTKEICNGYTELNDPAEQRRRFQQQLLNKEQNNFEVPVCDESFCTALEYGLPPTAGLGIGIDRLAMILTNSKNMKDVMLFPILRPE